MTRPATPSPQPAPEHSDDLASEPRMRLARWPRRSANHPVGSSSATSAISPAARTRATIAGETFFSCTHHLLLHPPQQVEAVHEPFETGEPVGQIEREVTSILRSIRR